MVKKNTLLTMLFMGIVSAILLMIYLVLRLDFFINGSYSNLELLLAWSFLLSELFTLMHSLNYMLNLVVVLWHGYKDKKLPLTYNIGKNAPHIAVVHCSYKEPLALVEDGLICLHNLQYANKEIYLLDDTIYDDSWQSTEEKESYKEAIETICKKTGSHLFRHTWRGAKAGILNDFISYIQGTPKEDSSLIWNNDNQRPAHTTYIAIFDIDMNPFPNFLSELVPIIESNNNLAYVQTPQYYTNFEYNNVARASGLLQSIFYEYICEGKDYHNAMFCCGTNTIVRIKALNDIDGFDETNVTEDFATSFLLQLKGWGSKYYNKILTFGLGPEDLGALLRQQFRWSLGTAINLVVILKSLFKNPTALKPRVWIEYLLSASYYCVGITFFILALIPCIYIILDIPSFLFSTRYYILYFVPYLFLSFSLFLWTLRLRRLQLHDIFLGLYVLAVCFPAYIKATCLGLTGHRGEFQVTPKGTSYALPLRDLWPQIALSLFSICAFTWGILRMIYEPDVRACLAINTLWVLFHYLLLSSIILFNNPVTKKQF